MFAVPLAYSDGSFTMQYDSKRGDHTKLVLQMADKQGIDLAELVMRADVSPDELEDAVDRCVGCLHPTKCAHLLDNAGDTISLPGFCRNETLFERLKSV